MPELWTIRQVMAYLKVSKATVYRYVKTKKLPGPAKRFGARRWDAEQVRKAVADG